MADKPKQLLKVLVVGDVMLGRLVDQLFKTRVNDPEHSSYVKRVLSHLGKQHLPHSYVWGDMLPYFHSADLRIINLETSATTHPEKWPDKAFNYRMHPENLQCLNEARIDYCSLANNHTLDYQVPGMFETMQSLDKSGIKWAGVGKNKEQAQKPTILSFGGKTMACFSFADHYDFWAATKEAPGINYIDVDNYTDRDIDEIKMLTAEVRTKEKVDLIAVSLHWGSNYCWQPSPQFVKFAHQLVDNCGVDLIHGHSSHHIQGVEVYKGKPILYGCGDFVDDYAVDKEFRNDLGFIYQLYLDSQSTKWKSIELVPTKIATFQVTRPGNDRDFLITRMKELSAKFGTNWTDTAEGTLVYNIAT